MNASLKVFQSNLSHFEKYTKTQIKISKDVQPPFHSHILDLKAAFFPISVSCSYVSWKKCMNKYTGYILGQLTMKGMKAIQKYVCHPAKQSNYTSFLPNELNRRQDQKE